MNFLSILSLRFLIHWMLNHWLAIGIDEHGSAIRHGSFRRFDLPTIPLDIEKSGNIRELKK